MSEAKEQMQYALLGEIISRQLLPLVSPYDLSDVARMNHWHNNPTFRAVANAIIDLIVSRPLTVEKIMNDLQVLQTTGQLSPPTPLKP